MKGRFWRLPIVVSACVVLIWVLGSANLSPALAAGLLQEGGGRSVTPADWSGWIPLALAAAAVALIVDAIFIFYMVKVRKNDQAGK